ncbi:MAG: FG-GAP repeat domain-containing protein [Nitrospirota bacterium]
MIPHLVHRLLLCAVLFSAACATHSADRTPPLLQGEAALSEADANVLMKSYHAGPRPTDPVCADLNGDGYQDIAVALKKQTLVVMLNDRNGGFSPPVQYETFPHNTSLTAADIDGDGDPDLVALTEVKVGPFFLNDGKGNFTRHDPDIPALLYSWHIESADLNNDSLPDLVVSSLQRPFLGILINRGNLQFDSNRINLMPELEEPDRRQFASSPQTGAPSAEAAAKETGREGKPLQEGEGARVRKEDLSMVPPSGQTSSPDKTQEVQPTAGSGSQKWRYAKRVKALDNGFKDLVIGDINGDGSPDILTPSYVFDSLYVGLNDGKGNFQFASIPVEPELPYELGYALSSVALLRYPGRTVPDVAVSSERDGRIYLFENNNGKLRQKGAIETNLKVPVRITADDMNGDGLPDIAVTFAAPLPDDTKSTIQIWLNSRDGFLPGESFRSEGQSIYLDTCRLSPGALPSVVVSNVHEETLNIFRPVR